MTKRERILAAIKREPTDRTPYAFWRHFPNVDRSPAALAPEPPCLAEEGRSGQRQASARYDEPE